MTIAPVSGDLLIKLGIGVLAAGLVVWGVRKASAAASDTASQLFTIPAKWWNTATDAAYALSPTNTNNVFATGANAGLSGALGRETTLGGEIYDLFNPDPMAPPPAPDPWRTQGRFNNPSAFVAPGFTGSGGAAFGIYPRP